MQVGAYLTDPRPWGRGDCRGTGPSTWQAEPRKIIPIFSYTQRDENRTSGLPSWCLAKRRMDRSQFPSFLGMDRFQMIRREPNLGILLAVPERSH